MALHVYVQQAKASGLETWDGSRGGWGHQVLQGSSRLGPWEANQAIGFVRASCVCVIFFLGGGSGSGWGRLNGTRAARLR